MKIFRNPLLAALMFFMAQVPALAQWQTQAYSIPVGKGSGATGFDAAVPGAAGNVLTSNGTGAKPSFQPATAATGVQFIGGLQGTVGTVQGIKPTGSGNNITLDAAYVGQVTAALFSAYGDNTHDDTTALNNFTAFLGTAPYLQGVLQGTVGSTFKLTGPLLLAQNSNVIGSSVNTQLNFQYNGSLIQPLNAANARNFSAKLSRVIIDGGSISSFPATTCFFMDNATGWILEDLVCQNANDGIDVHPHVQFISNITKANPAVVTLTAAPAFVNGDTIFINNVAGMTQVNSGTYVVAGLSGTSFQLSGINSTSYGAYTSGGTVNKGTAGFDAANYNRFRNVSISVARNSFNFEYFANANTVTMSRVNGGVTGIIDAGDNNSITQSQLENVSGDMVHASPTSTGFVSAYNRYEASSGSPVGNRILSGASRFTLVAPFYEGAVVGSEIADSGTATSWLGTDGLKVNGGTNMTKQVSEVVTYDFGTIAASTAVQSSLQTTGKLSSVTSTAWSCTATVNGSTMAAFVSVQAWAGPGGVYLMAFNPSTSTKTPGSQGYRVTCQGWNSTSLDAPQVMYDNDNDPRLLNRAA